MNTYFKIGVLLAVNIGALVCVSYFTFDHHNIKNQPYHGNITTCLIINRIIAEQRCCSIIVKTHDQCMDVFPNCADILNQTLNASACCANDYFNIFTCDMCPVYIFNVIINDQQYNSSTVCEPLDYNCIELYKKINLNTNFTCLYDNNKIYPIFEVEIVSHTLIREIIGIALIVLLTVILITLITWMIIHYRRNNEESIHTPLINYA